MKIGLIGVVLSVSLLLLTMGCTEQKAFFIPNDFNISDVNAFADVNFLAIFEDLNLLFPDVNNALYLNGIPGEGYIRTDGSSVTTATIPYSVGSTKGLSLTGLKMYCSAVGPDCDFELEAGHDSLHLPRTFMGAAFSMGENFFYQGIGDAGIRQYYDDWSPDAPIFIIENIDPVPGSQRYSVQKNIDFNGETVRIGNPVRNTDLNIYSNGAVKLFYNSDAGVLNGTDANFLNDVNANRHCFADGTCQTTASTGLPADFNAQYDQRYYTQIDLNGNGLFQKKADMNSQYYSQQDANTVLVKKADYNSLAGQVCLALDGSNAMTGLALLSGGLEIATGTFAVDSAGHLAGQWDSLGWGSEIMQDTLTAGTYNIACDGVCSGGVLLSSGGTGTHPITIGSVADIYVANVLSQSRNPLLTTNGFVKTSSSNGTLSVDTTSYYSANVNPSFGDMNARSAHFDRNVSIDANISASIYRGSINWIYTLIGMTGTTACDNLDGKIAGWGYTCQTCIDATVGTTVACGTTATANEQCACKVD